MTEEAAPAPYRAHAWRTVGRTAAIVVVADQITKLVARWQLADVPPYRAIELMPDVAYLYLHTNEVAAFDLLSGLPGPWRQGVFLALTAIFVGYLAWLVHHARPEQERDLGPIALLIGGFVGNGIDRLVWGAVVDFVVLHLPGTSFAANVADVAILAGLLGWFGNRWRTRGTEEATS